MIQLLRALLAALIGLLLGFFTPLAASAAPSLAACPAYHYDSAQTWVASTDAVAQRGPPAAYDRTIPDYGAVGHLRLHGASGRIGHIAPGTTTTYTTLGELTPEAKAPGTTDAAGRADVGELSSFQRSQAAAKTGTEIRRVGDVLESMDDVMANPQLLGGKSPAQVESILKDTPGWRVETLGKGSAKGRGWVFRQYTERGHPTGQMLRWHPGGGHHGPDPYWRVKGPNGDLGGIVR